MDRQAQLRKKTPVPDDDDAEPSKVKPGRGRGRGGGNKSRGGGGRPKAKAKAKALPKCDGGKGHAENEDPCTPMRKTTLAEDPESGPKEDAPQARRGKKRAVEGSGSKPCAKPKAKAKAKQTTPTKSPPKRTPKKASPKKAAARKDKKGDAEEGKEKTFASRRRAPGEAAGLRWQVIRDSFDVHVRPHIPTFVSKAEDLATYQTSLCCCYFRCLQGTGSIEIATL